MNSITIEQLKQMTDTEGLVLKGCGGDLKEWVDGINELFTTEHILLDGDIFRDVAAFEHEGLTNLLFKMDNVKLDVGKLAVWRLNTHDHFGGTWLSDYLINRLCVDPENHKQTEGKLKPDCPLIGQDGNIFNLIGIAAKTLENNGMAAEAKEMRERTMSSGSYEEALNILGEYVNITSVEDMSEEDEKMNVDYEIGGFR